MRNNLKHLGEIRCKCAVLPDSAVRIALRPVFSRNRHRTSVRLYIGRIAESAAN
jgi:hypothetical protein